MTGIFLVKLHFFHRLYLHWVHHRLWLCLPWRSPVVGSLDWSRFMSSFFMENGRIMVVIPFYSLQKKIYKDIVSCSLKWVIFLFHGSTDFMNSWQHDAVEFPLMNEERKLGVSLGVDTTEGWMVSIFHEDWLNLFSTGILGIYPGWSIPLYSFIPVTSNHFID